MIDKDNSLLPLCRQGTKKGKEPKQAKMPHQLLIILHLLVIIGFLFIIIIVVGSMCRADAKSSQLSRSQRDIWFGDGWVDRHARELKKRLILLTMNDLLVAPDDLNALLHHLHVLICVTAYGKDTLEHLQDAKVGARGGGGTTTAGSARRSHN
jgi:hypothetical protein